MDEPPPPGVHLLYVLTLRLSAQKSAVLVVNPVVPAVRVGTVADIGVSIYEPAIVRFILLLLLYSEMFLAMCIIDGGSL